MTRRRATWPGSGRTNCSPQLSSPRRVKQENESLPFRLHNTCTALPRVVLGRRCTVALLEAHVPSAAFDQSLRLRCALKVRVGATITIGRRRYALCAIKICEIYRKNRTGVTDNRQPTTRTAHAQPPTTRTATRNRRQHTQPTRNRRQHAKPSRNRRQHAQPSRNR